MIAAFALLTCLAHGASVDEHLPTALATDDQCALEGCAVNALQLRSKDILNLYRNPSIELYSTPQKLKP